MFDTQTMAGTLVLTLHDPRGRPLARREVRNLVTDAGRALVAELFAGRRVGAIKARLVVGGGAAAPTPSDTALGQPLDLVDLGEAQISVNGARVSLTGRIPERDKAMALTEAGIALAFGSDPLVLYNRVVFEVVNKAPNMQMTLAWSVDFSGGKP